MTKPLVSVGIAAFNCARFIEGAIESALAQDLRDIEVLVVDDGSEDDTALRAQRMAERDSRVRVESRGRLGGPGAARNRALEMARGEWFAVLDGDDLMHPARLDRLTARAIADGAEIAADDLLVFDDADPSRTHRFLRGRRARGPTWLGAEAFLRETRLYARPANLGYLKPIIRLEAWRASGVRYEESVAIGEDHDLMLRLLLAGLRCRIDPFLGYFYRRHPASTSHRLSGAALAALAEQDERRCAQASVSAPPSLRRALDGLSASVATAVAFDKAVAALKARRPAAALAVLA
ncbi:MAG: glycosyltransferase family 2 protein, partial [Caulobacteraceae bacterium]